MLVELREQGQYNSEKFKEMYSMYVLIDEFM